MTCFNKAPQSVLLMKVKGQKDPFETFYESGEIYESHLKCAGLPVKEIKILLSQEMKIRRHGSTFVISILELEPIRVWPGQTTEITLDDIVLQLIVAHIEPLSSNKKSS